MFKHVTLRIALAVLLAVALSTCSGQAPTTPPAQALPSTSTAAALSTAQATAGPTSAGTQTLSVMTHDSFGISKEVLDAFEIANNVKVQFFKAGDAGTALNKAILSKDKPLADVFYGVDNTYLSRALNEDIYETYNSPLLAKIPDKYKLDSQNRALPVDYGDVCLNYDKAYFTGKNLTPPQNLEDLLKPEYKSLLVVENPSSSSPGLAFLLATIAHFGEKGYLDYWKGLAQNDLKVVQDWETAYYTDFSGSSGKGPRPIVVSYGSSPAFEAVYAKPPLDEPPTAAITANDSCFRQIEFVGILKGTVRRALAEKWVDFMLSVPFQENMLSQMAVYPVNGEAKLDPAFARFLSIPEKPAILSPETIAANRDKWIQDWTDLVLR